MMPNTEAFDWIEFSRNLKYKLLIIHVEHISIHWDKFIVENNLINWETENLLIDIIEWRLSNERILMAIILYECLKINLWDIYKKKKTIKYLSHINQYWETIGCFHYWPNETKPKFVFLVTIKINFNEHIYY